MHFRHHHTTANTAVVVVVYIIQSDALSVIFVLNVNPETMLFFGNPLICAHLSIGCNILSCCCRSISHQKLLVTALQIAPVYYCIQVRPIQ